MVVRSVRGEVVLFPPSFLFFLAPCMVRFLKSSKKGNFQLFWLETCSWNLGTLFALREKSHSWKNSLRCSIIRQNPCSITFMYICSWPKVKVKSLSHVRLFATPWTVAHQAPPSMGLSRQEYCSGLPFPSLGDLPDPRIDPRSPTLQADALTFLSHQGSSWPN